MDEQKAAEKLEKKLKELEREKEEFLAGWQRAKADFANYKKEEKDRLQGFMEYTRGELLYSLLSIVDNLERAEQELGEKDKESKVVQGFLQTGKQLHGFLKQQGVKEIEAEGKDFNPALHEAISVVQGLPGQGEKSGKVAQVLEKGYMVHDKLLRPTKVNVVK